MKGKSPKNGLTLSVPLNAPFPHHIKHKSHPSVVSVFNSISDLHNTYEINNAIKVLPSVPSRLMLIDKVLKRQQEIQTSNELNQITKLAPVFNRLKQKFLQKLRMSRMNKNNPTQTFQAAPLFQKQLLSEETQTKHAETSRKKTFVRMIAHFNDHGQVARRSNVSQIMTESMLETVAIGLNNESHIALKVPIKFYRRKSPTKLCRFSTVFNTNSKYQGKIEKDLLNIVKKTDDPLKILNMGSPSRSLEHFDCKIKLKLANLLSNKPFVTQKLKNPMKNIKTPKNLHIRSNNQSDLKTSFAGPRSMKSLGEESCKAYKSIENNDESYVSYTEMKLMSLYKESKKMREEIENIEKKVSFDRTFRESQRDKLRKDLKKNVNEILGVVKRKLA